MITPNGSAGAPRFFTDYSLPRETIEDAIFYDLSSLRQKKTTRGLILLVPRDIVAAMDISPNTSPKAGKKTFRVIIVRTK